MGTFSWNEVLEMIGLLGTTVLWIKSLGYDKRDREQTKADVRDLKTETSDHYKDCNERREELAKMSGKVSSIEASVNRIESLLMK